MYSTLLSVLFFAASSIAGPISRRTNTTPEYVVMYSTSSDLTMSSILAQLSTASRSSVNHQYNNTNFQGFSARMYAADVAKVQSMPGVTIGLVKPIKHATFVKTQSPWGLQKISTNQVPIADEMLNHGMYYTDASLGRGVDVYILDTGINIEHIAFTGRANSVWSYNNDESDGNGHGTHVAGIATGEQFGIASHAQVHNYRILDASGTGDSSDVINALNKVIQAHTTVKQSGHLVGSVINLSLEANELIDTVKLALQAATEAGIHVVVAAGNSAANACNTTPAYVGGDNGPIITVGSSDASNKISAFSNTGSCVDVYAPGEQIVSAWNGGVRSTMALSGTSMAAPHVTGIIATLIASYPHLATSPAGMKQYLRDSARSGVLQASSNMVLTSGDRSLLVSVGLAAVKAPS